MTDGGVRADEQVEKRPGKPWWLSLIEILLVFLVCHGLALLIQRLPPRHSYPHLIWLMEGANLAAVVLFGFKAWLGVLPAQWLANSTFFSSLVSVAACAARLALVQWLLPRFRFNSRMEKLRDLFVLLGLIWVVLAANGLIVDSLLLWRTHVIPAGEFWLGLRTWWIGDMTGVLIMTPLLLLWAVPAQRRILMDRWKEFLVLLAASLAANVWVGHQSALPGYDRYPLSYPLNPLLIWAALRFGPLGVATTGFLVLLQSLLLNWSTWSAVSASNWFGTVPFPVLQLSFSWLVGLILGFVVQELHRAREVQQSSHQALSSLVETSPLAIVAVNRSRQVLQWNRAAHALFGWSSGEVLGQPLPSPEWDGLQDVVAAVLSGQSLSCTREGAFRRDDGMRRIHIDAAPLFDANGDLVAGVALIADMTAQRQMEERLRQSQRLETVGRLAGGIAHDFNNLLTVILGQAELLLAKVKDNHVRERIERLHGAAFQASSLIARLLTFSRQQRVEPRRIDLNQSVLRCTGMLRRIIGEDVELETDLAVNLNPVLADAGQLEQLLMNLVINARDAMPEGGRLRIFTRHQNLPVDSGRPEPVSQGVLLAVEDSGHGMPAEVRARMFDPFFTTREIGQGTGLGLAIVYGIVRQTGGVIHVWSEVDQGTRIEIVFPAAAGDAGHPRSAEDRTHRSAQPLAGPEETGM